MSVLSRSGLYTKPTVAGGGGDHADTVSWAAKVLADGYTVLGPRYTAMNTLITNLDAGGVWGKLAGLALLTVPDKIMGKVCVKRRITMTESGTGDWALLNASGFGPDVIGYGSVGGSYIDTLYNPSTAGGTFQRDSCFVLVGSNITGNDFKTAFGNTATHLAPMGGADSMYCRLQNASTMGAIPVFATGGYTSYKGGSRSGSATGEYFCDFTTLSSFTDVSEALSNENFLIGASLQGTPSLFYVYPTYDVAWGSYLNSTERVLLVTQLELYRNSFTAKLKP